MYDKTKSSTIGFVRAKKNIYQDLIYNCLEVNWRKRNMLYQEPLKVLEGEAYKNYEGIIFDELNPEKNSVHLISNAEISQIFETERFCLFF